MKRILIVLGLILLSSGVTAFAFKLSGLNMEEYRNLFKPFSDNADFAEWYKEPAENMKRLGVVKGFPDGSFKPNATVTRAELVTILDRYAAIEELKRYDDIVSTLSLYDKYKDSDLEDEQKMALVVATLGVGLLDEPLDATTIEEDCSEITSDSIENDFTLYDCTIGGYKRSYVHIIKNNAYRSGGDGPHDVDKWFSYPIEVFPYAWQGNRENFYYDYIY